MNELAKQNETSIYQLVDKADQEKLKIAISNTQSENY